MENKLTPFTPEALFTRDEVAAALKVSVCSVDRLRKTGLPAIKLPGGLVRFNGSELNAFLKEVADV